MPEFNIGANESILHFLAYHNYTAQVLSMCELLQENDFAVEEGTGLKFRIALCSVVGTLKEVTTSAELERVIRTLDNLLQDSDAVAIWAEFRPTLVAQVVVTMLREKVGLSSISDEVLHLDPRALTGISKREVRSSLALAPANFLVHARALASSDCFFFFPARPPFTELAGDAVASDRAESVQAVPVQSTLRAGSYGIDSAGGV